MVRQRAREAGVTERITPHSFRASFLTFGNASLDARQAAAGHADAATTQLYDRRDWRGREAFELMPEVEDL
jgi:integrase/recombinase XerD